MPRRDKKRKASDADDAPSKEQKVDNKESTVRLQAADIACVFLDEDCAEEDPCQHNALLITTAHLAYKTILDGVELASMIKNGVRLNVLCDDHFDVYLGRQFIEQLAKYKRYGHHVPTKDFVGTIKPDDRDLIAKHVDGYLTHAELAAQKKQAIDDKKRKIAKLQKQLKELEE